MLFILTYGHSKCHSIFKSILIQAKSTAGDLDRRRGIAHGERVLDSQGFTNPFLKLLHHGPIVGKPTLVQDIIDSDKKRFPSPNIRATEMEWGIFFGTVHCLGKWLNLAELLLGSFAHNCVQPFVHVRIRFLDGLPGQGLRFWSHSF
jgi:hypothetical protein